MGTRSALAIATVAGAGVVVVANQGRPRSTCATEASVPCRAGIAVSACGGVVGINALPVHRTAVVGAGVVVVANQGRPSTCATDANVPCRAGIAVSACGVGDALNLADGRAAVAVDQVAVVALLAGGHNAVAATGRRAVIVAAVAVDDVAVVALLIAFQDVVAANRVGAGRDQSVRALAGLHVTNIRRARHAVIAAPVGGAGAVGRGAAGEVGPRIRVHEGRAGRDQHLPVVVAHAHGVISGHVAAGIVADDEVAGAVNLEAVRGAVIAGIAFHAVAEAGGEHAGLARARAVPLASVVGHLAVRGDGDAAGAVGLGDAAKDRAAAVQRQAARAVGHRRAEGHDGGRSHARAVAPVVADDHVLESDLVHRAEIDARAGAAADHAIVNRHTPDARPRADADGAVENGEAAQVDRDPARLDDNALARAAAVEVGGEIIRAGGSNGVGQRRDVGAWLHFHERLHRRHGRAGRIQRALRERCGVGGAEQRGHDQGAERHQRFHNL